MGNQCYSDTAVNSQRHHRTFNSNFDWTLYQNEYNNDIDSICPRKKQPKRFLSLLQNANALLTKELYKLPKTLPYSLIYSCNYLLVYSFIYMPVWSRINYINLVIVLYVICSCIAYPVWTFCVSNKEVMTNILQNLNLLMKKKRKFLGGSWRMPPLPPTPPLAPDNFWKSD